MTNLKGVEFGLNKYCGPSVLSILTGKSTDECASTISKITGQYKITGVFTPDLLKAARLLNFENELVHQGGSLYMAITMLRKAKRTGKFIVSLTNHFVVIEISEDGKVYFCDNHTKEPMPASSSARLTQQVVQIHRVWELEHKKVPQPKGRLVKATIGSYYVMAEEITYMDDDTMRVRLIDKISFGSIKDRDDFIQSIKNAVRYD